MEAGEWKQVIPERENRMKSNADVWEGVGWAAIHK